MAARETQQANSAVSTSVYWKVGGVLAILTALEVACVYVEALQNHLALILVLIGIIKFILVAAYFMHLKFDAAVYTGFFVVGVIMALATFIGVLAMNPPAALGGL